MALTDETSGTNTTMLVQPTGFGGGNGFMDGGFGGWWIILLLLCLGNGMWGGFGGGMWPAMMGGMGMDGFGLYPWLNNSQNINAGFRDQAIGTQLSGIQSSITSGFGDIQTALCGGFAGVNATVAGAQNALSQQLYTNEIANLNRSFAEQTANTAGFTGLSTGVADLKYTVATENCADRAAAYQNTRDIIDAQTSGTQAILNKLCQLELDTEKARSSAKDDTIAQLRSELLYARGQASQVAQTADIRANNATVANQLVAELRSCPIPAQPVYGNQPIFTCGGNGSYGCGCNGIAA